MTEQVKAISTFWISRKGDYYRITSIAEGGDKVTISWMQGSYTRETTVKALEKHYKPVEVPAEILAQYEASKANRRAGGSKGLKTRAERLKEPIYFESRPDYAHAQCSECRGMFPDDMIQMGQKQWNTPVQHFCNECAKEVGIIPYDFNSQSSAE